MYIHLQLDLDPLDPLHHAYTFLIAKGTLEALVALSEVPLPTALAVPIPAAILILDAYGALRVEELGTDPCAVLPGKQ